MSVDHRLIIYLDGKIPTGMINPEFLTQQDAWDNVEKIQAILSVKRDMFQAVAETDNPDELKKLAKDLELCEFEIQKLFNFPENVNYHRFWEAPKCLCPKLDNQDYWGTKYCIRNANCPLHGGKGE